MKFYEANSEEVRLELEKNKEYFDNMFKGIDDNIILDEQQRIAVVLNASNLLVVAGAGSGKTTTMVAKVKYLIDKCNYKESEIVVLSFTKKVKEELKRIINDGFGYKGVKVSTFHALGLDIIKTGGENYNDIVDDAGQYKILSKYIKEELFKDKDKFSLFIDAFSKKVYFNNDWKNYSTFEEYHNAVYKENMNKNKFDIKEYNKFQIIKRLKYKKTINGEYVRSKEEADIANYLYIHGIDYAYEKKFDKNKNIEWYHPDFYIKQAELENYIEHFGIDEDGHNEMYTDQELNNYLINLKIKQSFFNEKYNRDLFIVTYSKYNDGSTYKYNLNKQLIDKGYVLERRSDDEIYNRLRDTSQDTYYSKFINFIISFISLFKQQGYKLNDFDILINQNDGDLKRQLMVLKDFYIYYQNELEEKRLIDFEDMIYKAYIIMPKIKEHNLGVDYKYLIIDEYQDISKQRLNLVRKMSDLFDAKVMAVGDDWQTIFGYSGSRVDLFKNFEEEMEDAKSVPIEHTYRNSQELIDIAGDFILKNEDQIEKKLISDKSILNPVGLLVYDDSKKTENNINRSIILDKLIDRIYNINSSNRVLLLGRYKNDRYKIQNESLFKISNEKITSLKHKDMHIDFLTIHKAKGLGYDYCVLLDLADGVYGFPSKIEDEPVMKLIKPKINEPVDYPEERRLFYVALTRTKNKIYMLVPKSKASSFAREIKNYANVEIIKNI